MTSQKVSALLVICRFFIILLLNEYLLHNGYDCKSSLSDFDNQTLNFSNFDQNDSYINFGEFFNFSSSNITQLVNLTTPEIYFSTTTPKVITSSIISTFNYNTSSSISNNISNLNDYEYELQTNQTISTTTIVYNSTEIVYNTTEIINILSNDSTDDSTLSNQKSVLIINLINSHRVYFLILSFVIIFLLIFILLMMCFNYKLSKRNKNCKNKFLRNRKNISFDIIDSGYRLNRNSAKILNRTDSVMSSIINDKLETNFNSRLNNLNQTYERITNDSNENIYELPYIDSSILINDKSTYYKSANNEFKFQTFNAKKFENIKNSKKCDFLDLKTTQLNEHKYDTQPVIEYGLKSFNPTANENRKNTISSRATQANTEICRKNKISTELISINSNDSENESDYGENQNLSIDLNYRGSMRNLDQENNNNKSFQPKIFSKCVETSFNPKSLTSTTRVKNFKEFQI